MNRRMAAGRLVRWAVMCAILIQGPAIARDLYGKRPPLPAMGPSYRQVVDYNGAHKPGELVIQTGEKRLLRILPDGKAEQFRISVGRQGFKWHGIASIGAKRTWPDWKPPEAMRGRAPDLPEIVPPGPFNPLGARALYLFIGGRDSLYRIHGTNDVAGVGFDNSSGCFRLTNTDIVYLYDKVPIGAKVTVEN